MHNILKKIASVTLGVSLLVNQVIPVLPAYAATQTTVTLQPVADTDVRSDSPTTNYGKAQSIHVSTNPVEYVYYKFDLSSLSGKTVTNATLSLHVSNASANSQQVVAVENASWNENDITYTNRPAVTTSVITTFSQTTVGTTAIDLSPYIKANIGTVVSFALVGTGSDAMTIDSKETATPPVLTVSVEEAPTPTVIQPTGTTPQPTAIPTASISATPTPATTTSLVPVYDEQLASGWVDWSWSSQNNFTDATKPYQGSKDLDWKTTSAYAGLYLHASTSVDTTNLTSLTFALQATKPTVTIHVQAYDNTDKGIGQDIDITPYATSVSGNYTLYAIPLNVLGAGNTNINGIHFQDVSGETTNEFYLDNVGFTSTTLQVTPSPTQAIPTPTVTSTPSVTPTPSQATGSVYSDSLASNWQNWSWDSTINFASTTPVYTGTTAILYSAKAAWSGMDLHNPSGFSTTNFNTLHFAMQAQTAGAKYAVFMTDNTGAQLTTPIALSTLGGDPVQGSWKSYNIPLSTLQAANKTVTGIIIHDISGSAQSVVAVDDVQFTNATAEVATVSNGVPNSSVEQVSTSTNGPLGWYTNTWGTNAATFSYLTTGHSGTHSVKTEVTSYTSGDAKWYYDAQPVVAGKQYMFKDYYQSNVQTRVTIEFTLTDGTKAYAELKPAVASTSWKQYVGSFTAPANAKTAVMLHVISTVGYLVVDDYQVGDYVPVGFTRGIVTITFDDGVQSQYTKAYPILKKYSMPATFYLTSGFLDTNFYMTTTQAKALKSAGHELADHTINHPNLTTVSETEIKNQLAKSQADLQTKFGVTINDFATPYGAYNDTVLKYAKQYFRSHRSVEVGYNSKDSTDLYDIKVQNVYTTTKVSEVQAWVQKAKQDKTWLVLVYHQVDNPSDDYSVSSSDFDKHLSSIKSSGLVVKTLDQAIKEIQPQL